MSRGRTIAGATLLALGLAAGCSAAPFDPGDKFVAQNSDFRGYEEWPSFAYDDGTVGGVAHVAGKRTIYINRELPAGATEFPVGTIIVKETAADGKIFARAKRGGTFNSTGAVGWEWFELQTVRGTTGIRWRGKGPPAGEMYGGDPNAGCNMCHKLAAANDYVLAPGLVIPPAGDAGADAGTGADAGVDAGGADDASQD